MSATSVKKAPTAGAGANPLLQPRSAALSPASPTSTLVSGGGVSSTSSAAATTTIIRPQSGGGGRRASGQRNVGSSAASSSSSVLSKASGGTGAVLPKIGKGEDTSNGALHSPTTTKLLNQPPSPSQIYASPLAFAAADPRALPTLDSITDSSSRRYSNGMSLIPSGYPRVGSGLASPPGSGNSDGNGPTGYGRRSRPPSRSTSPTNDGSRGPSPGRGSGVFNHALANAPNNGEPDFESLDEQLSRSSVFRELHRIVRMCAAQPSCDRMVMTLERQTRYLINASVVRLFLVQRDGLVHYSRPQPFHLNTGIVGYVRGKKEIVNLTHPTQDERYVADIDQVSERPAPVALMCVPVEADSRPDAAGPKDIVAIFQAFREKDGDAFTTRDCKVLYRLGEFAGNMLRNSRSVDRAHALYNASLQSHKRSAALLDVAKALASETTLDKVVGIIVSQVPELLDSDRCTLFFVDREKEQLIVTKGASKGRAKNLVSWIFGQSNAPELPFPKNCNEIRFSMRQGIAGHVAMSGETLNIVDAHTDPRFNSTMDKETGYRTRSILCVPMVDSAGVIIGVVQAINKNPMFPRFDAQDETLLKTFAAQAALAVRNAQLFSKTVNSLKQSDALLDVTKALSQELKIEALIQIICSKVQQLLHSERCTLFMVDKERKELYTSEHMSFGMGPALPIDREKATLISFPMDRGIAGSVATTLQPVNIPDAYKDPRFNKNMDKETGFRTRSILCFPEDDTRVLTSKGFLFLDQIEALLAKGETITYAAYDRHSQSFVYCKGELRLPPGSQHNLVNFSHPSEEKKWNNDSTKTEKDGESNQLSLRVTNEHVMFVQQGLSSDASKVDWSSWSKFQANDLLPLSCDCAGAADCEHQRQMLRLTALAENGVVRDSLASSQQLQSIQSQLRLDSEVQFDAFLQLYAIWLNQGAQLNQRLRALSFTGLSSTQSNQIQSLLTSILHLRHDIDFTSSPSCDSLSIHNSWFQVFSQQYSSSSSSLRLFSWMLTACTKQQLRTFLAALSSSSNTISTSSSALCDDLLIVALQAGYTAHANATVDSRWVLTYCDASNSSLSYPSLARHSGVKQEKFQGRTWCVEVEHEDHLIVAQRALRNETTEVIRVSRPVVVGNCYPIVNHRKECVGCVQVINKEDFVGGTFDESDEKLLSAFCSQAAVAIENSRLFDQTERALNHALADQRNMKFMLSVTKNLFSDMHLSSMIDQMTMQVHHLLKADDCAVYLADPEAKLFWLAKDDTHVASTTGESHATKFPFTTGIVGVVASTGETIRISSGAHSDPRFSALVDQRKGKTTHSILCTPVRAELPDGNFRVVGVISVRDEKDRGGFEQEEEKLLKVFASQAAVAIMNSKKFQTIMENADIKTSDTSAAEYLKENRGMQLASDDINAFNFKMEDIKMQGAIGTGSYGEVYKAIVNSEVVAVKKLHVRNLKAEQVDAFCKEASLMCQLKHPNIVGFIGAVTEPSNLSIITEYCARGSLADLLLDDKIWMNFKVKVKFALEAATGMLYLHKSNPPILHRDLKSDNLLVTQDWLIKVADFGLTRFMSEKKQMTQVGTPMWMSPEIIMGKRYTSAADCYAFGIVLWEILTRLEPYEEKEPMQIVVEVVNDGLRPTIPAECADSPLVPLMKDCWHTDPQQRPPFEKIVERLKAIQTAIKPDDNSAFGTKSGAQGPSGTNIAGDVNSPVN